MAEPRVSYAQTPIWNAAEYDAPRRRLVPDFDGFYGTVADLVVALGRPDPAVLDLGAGTGILAETVRLARPAARLTLLDGSPAMLDVARQRLGERATFVVGDLTDRLPDGPYDAVVSSLAIHHLTDDAKRALFGRVLTVLRPGGLFANAEQVSAPNSWLERLYRELHERDARRLGADDAEWGGAVQRMVHDRCATVDAQLDWLRDLGFEGVDVAYKRYRFAVYAGFAPGGRHIV